MTPHPRDRGSPSSTAGASVDEGPDGVAAGGGAGGADDDAVPSPPAGAEQKTTTAGVGAETTTNATTTTVTWLTLARREIYLRPEHLDPELVDVLRSFGGDDAPGPACLDLDDDDADTADIDCGSNGDDVPSLISAILTSEVDGAQADMFARRFSSVDSLLLRQHRESSSDHHHASDVVTETVTTPSLLRLALHRRARQILSEEPPPQPRALRIRALVDFLWSQAQVLDPVRADALRDLPTPEDLARDLELESRYATVLSVDVPAASSDGDTEGGTYVVRHGVIDGMSSCGPVHVNVLRIRNPHLGRMVTVDARDRTTDLPELAGMYGAAAAISGGYFLYSEPDIEEPSRRTDPVGLLVEPPASDPTGDNGGAPRPSEIVSGVMRNPPVFRRAALLQRCPSGPFPGGRVTIERIGMDGAVVEILPSPPTPRDVCGSGKPDDAPPPRREPSRFVVGSGGVRCVHRGVARGVHFDGGEAGISVVGTAVWEVAPSWTSSDDAGTGGDGDGGGRRRSLAVPLAGFVLVFPTGGGGGGGGTTGTPIVVGEIEPGDGVRVTLPSHPDLAAGMAGGPILLHDDDDDDDDDHRGGGRGAAPPPPLDPPAEDFRGTAPPLTFSQDETFDRNLLPRMGVGLTADGGELVVAAVDGRNLERALGMTLRGTAGLLRALGCTRAMNLDGGSSKRMVVGGRVVDLSTTEIRGGGNGGGDGGHPREGVGEVEATEEEAPAPAVELSRPVYSAILFLPPPEA